MTTEIMELNADGADAQAIANMLMDEANDISVQIEAAEDRIASGLNVDLIWLRRARFARKHKISEVKQLEEIAKEAKKEEKRRLHEERLAKEKNDTVRAAERKKANIAMVAKIAADAQAAKAKRIEEANAREARKGVALLRWIRAEHPELLERAYEVADAAQLQTDGVKT